MGMKTEYKVVTTVEEALNYIGDSKEVAFDFETAPNDGFRDEDKAALDPAKSHIVTMSISVKEGTGIMIPVAHKVGKNIDHEAFVIFLQAMMMRPSWIKIAHNLQFEAMFSYALGIVIQEPVYDTIAASQMSMKSATEFRSLSESGLKTLAAELCDEPLPSFTTVTGGKHFDELDPEDPETIRYSCADADFALRIEDLTAAIDRQQRAEAREAEFSKPVNAPITARPEKQVEDVKTGRASNAYKEDFGAHLRGKRPVHNVLSEGEQADGGFLVPEEFERQIVMGLDEANVVRGLAKVITTSAERKIPVAATHSTAAWTAENGAYTPSDPSFDQKTIDAFKLTDLVKVSIELLQDSMFDLESYIATEFARAFGIAEEEAFCVGTGTGQPTGIFTDNGGEVGITAAANNAVTADELFSLVYSLKSPYRRNAKWLMNDSTIAAIRKLKDGNGVYLWQPSLQAGEPDKLLGYELYTSPYAPTMASDALAIAFGDFKNYWIADRSGRTVQRLNELYSTNGQVGFVATERVDGKVILPEGIKLLKMKH